jgi:L-asparaginase
MTQKKILIIYTGGTIGMTEQFPGGPLVPFDFQNILAHLPELKRLTETIDIAPFPHPLDSSDVDPHVWMKIASIIHEHYEDYDGFVILHGTDTMAYTASALSFMLRNLNKPVIFTGSQLPIGKIRTDGKENLITAIEIACAEKNHQPMVQEVTIYFGSHLYRANRTTKFSAEGFEAFQSPNFPSLAEIGVHLQFREELLIHHTSSLLFNDQLDANIAILKIFPGIQSHYFEAIAQTPINGLIIESYGSGTIPQKDWLIQGIANLIERGVIILNISQCSQGLIDHALYKNAQKLFEIGVISGRDMTTETAVAKMMHVLGLPVSHEEKNNLLITPLAGELTPARIE